jgi:hypothetical protein
MKPGGMVMMVVGAIVSLASFLMGTSVHTDSSYAYGSYTPASDVINIGLLQQQQLVFAIGAALFVAGAVLLGAGAIVAELRAGARPLGLMGDVDAPVPRNESEQAALSEAPRATSEEIKRGNEQEKELLKWVGIVLAGVVAAIVLATLLAPKSENRSSVGSDAEMNAQSLAGNLEVQADNLEAMADNTSVAAAPKPVHREAEPSASRIETAPMDDIGTETGDGETSTGADAGNQTGE